MPTLPPPALIVRLRNWVGDVTLSLPLLQRLADEGHALTLVGKAWARDLLAAQGWPVHVLPATTRERVALLRRLRLAIGQPKGQQPDLQSGAPTAQQTGAPLAARAGARTRLLPRGGIDALCLPDSFSSALDFRLAGLRALGHAWEGRSLLLGRAVKRPRGTHELQVYWQLGDALLGRSAPLPARIGLRATAAQRVQARALRAAHGIEAGYVLICPFAGGTWNQQDKTWPAFAGFVAHGLQAYGRRIVVCPGPGDEERIAREHFAGAQLLAGVDLGVYTALLEDAALMLSNDTGPGHMAAAVGTPLVSINGPSDPRLWRPWGPSVQVLGGHGVWPDVAAVRDAVAGALAARQSAA
ncbi:MAG: hypothetical protein LH480_14710 [Rubrivivax sp.]|nr:hypothetical protein [Rubrivivax sp.]